MKTLALIFAALMVATTAQAKTYEYTAKVIKETDGDSIRVEIAGWPAPYNPISVRIDYIDTPEKRMPPAKSQCEVTLGKEASKFAATLAPVGSKVTVIYDDKRHDKYGRLLARIRLPNGKDFGQTMISKGYAHDYNGGKKMPWCAGDK